MSGFVYSKAFERPIERVPVIGEGEEETGIHWYPEVSWEQGEKQKTVAERLFNMEKDDHRKMVSASRFFCPFAGMHMFLMRMDIFWKIRRERKIMDRRKRNRFR